MVNNVIIMENRKIKRLSMSQFWEIIDSTSDKERIKPYLGNGYAMAKNIASEMKNTLFNGEPLRLEGMRIGLITSGEARVTINLTQRHMTPGTLVMLGNESIIQVQECSDDFNLTGIVIYDSTLKEILRRDIPSVFEMQMYDQQIVLNKEEQEVFMQLASLLYTTAHIIKDSMSMEYDIVSAILHLFENMSAKERQNRAGKVTREREIFYKFIQLVNNCSGTQRQLSYYADKLCMSQRYLGTVVRSFSGTKAKEWIDRAVITETKVLLRHTNLNISQISDRLDFPNPSFFCKFFRRVTGLSPLEYREK